MNWINLIINWYLLHKRELPWRSEKDPYKIWISEIILQQTRVEQGLSYYRRFITRFPDIYSLANAEESDVLKVWQGLGYYSRARNLQYAAKQLMEIFDGIIPSKKDELLTLKGIGDYTSSAISSIAFGNPDPVVDGNVYRFTARFFDINQPINSTKSLKYFTNILKPMMENVDPGTFNQSLMEIGATICKPVNPNCNICPVVSFCMAFKKQNIKDRPVVPKRVKPVKQFFNYLDLSEINNEACLFLTKRTHNIWKGLYEFPLYVSEKPINNAEISCHLSKMIDIKDIKLQASYKHQLTHKTIQAKFWKILFKRNSEFKKLSTFEIPLNELDKYPIHRLMDKYIKDLNLN
jgi:A/G-specific adenine glycosylase